MYVHNSYAEFILVKDAHNLIKLPDTLPLDVAAILPCGALMAYCAVLRVKPFVLERLAENPDGKILYISTEVTPRSKLLKEMLRNGSYV